MKNISLLSVLILLSFSCETPIYDELFDYTIEQRIECFCPNVGVWVKLYVESDTVASAYLLSNSQPLNYESFKFYKSIKELFELISEIDTTQYVLRYNIDSIYNYPSYIYIDLKPVIIGNDTFYNADTQSIYFTRNYTKLY